MNRIFVLSLFLLLGLLFPTGLLADNSVSLPPTVTFEEGIHFLTPGGETVVIGPGVYDVEAAEVWLRLVPEERRDAQLIEAEAMVHEEAVSGPSVRAVPNKKADQYVVRLLLPDGSGMEAIGSYSGVRSRGVISRGITSRGVKGLTTRGIKRTSLKRVGKKKSTATTMDPESGYQIQGSAKQTLKKKTVHQCIAACLETDKFSCKAMDYNRTTGTCRLSTKSGRGKKSSTHDFYVTSTAPVAQTPKGKCWSGAEKDGLFCYKKCKAGYNGVGPVCWKKCPSGYKNDGATCRKNPIIKKRASYGRGVGKPMGCGDREKDGALCYKKCKSGYNGVGPVCWKKCPSDYKNDGATCRKPVHIFSKKSYGRGVGKLFKKNCKGDCEKDAGLWYKKCKSGYNGRGPVCWQYCPSGYKNDGATCRRKGDIFAKKSYGRGAGKPLNTCASGQEKDAGLCYKKCKAGYKGVGPVCWGSCPKGFKNDGATCRKKGKIIAKKSYGRGAGYLQRGNYQRIFKRYIRDHHRMNRIAGKPLTGSEKQALKEWFPDSVLERVRVVDQSGMTGAFNFSASATTYGDDLVVVRKGRRSVGLLKHELVHVCQYEKLGRDGFAKEYANQYVDGGYDYNNMLFEIDAFDFAAQSQHIHSYRGENGRRASMYSSCK